jgi:hypothetical protein
MADTTVPAHATPVALSASAEDSGHDSGAKSTAMAASSPTRGATRMVVGEIPELLQEDDRDRRRSPSVPRPWMANR